MKFLLVAVNAKYIHSNPAVYSLRAYAGEQGIKACVREFTINQPSQVILREIYEEGPDVVAFSSYIWNIDMICRIGAELHRLRPALPIWVGGPEVSYNSRAFLKSNPWAFGVMRGEGEQTFTALCQGYLDGGELSHIQGLTFRRAAGIPKKDTDLWEEAFVQTPDRPVMELSRVPFIYEEPADFDHRIIYYESSRGCPYHCSYCLSSVDKQLRFRELSLVFAELSHFLKHRVPQVKFVDRTFNCRHDHALAIWRYIQEHDNGVTNFHFEVAADLLNEEELTLLSGMRPGLVQLEIGVQSTNSRTLEAIHRRMDVERLRRVTARIRSGRNIHQHLDLIAGLPFEDLSSFRNSFNEVFAMAPDQLQLGFLKVLKGSFMYDHAGEYDCLYSPFPPFEVLSTRWLSYEDILRLKRVEEMVEVYYNSAQFTCCLPVCMKEFPDAFAFFDALGLWYKEKGYLDISHVRLGRYELLMDFMRDSGHEELLWALKEWMLMDLYSREKLKSRPAWAKELKPYKEAIRSFYRKEADTGALLPALAGYDARQLERMTHLEPFKVILPEGGAVLFSYEERDPLNYSARRITVSLE